MSDIPVMPTIPPAKDRETKLLHLQIQQIVRRIALRALAGNHDILFAVYCAGLAHGAALSAKEIQ